jgi:hypothetical protein
MDARDAIDRTTQRAAVSDALNELPPSTGTIAQRSSWDIVPRS